MRQATFPGLSWIDAVWWWQEAVFERENDACHVFFLTGVTMRKNDHICVSRAVWSVCHSVASVACHDLRLKADDAAHDAPPERLSPRAMRPTTIHRSIVALNLPTNTLAFIKKGRAIVGAMSNNPLFPSPTPPLVTVSASLDALAAAEQATAARTKGTVEARDAARATVHEQLHQLGAYVQLVANADKENAGKIIAAASMSTKKSTASTKTDFAAKAGPVSGSVHLVARAADHRRAGYEWQWSGDGGKTWQLALVTLQAKTTITGLPVATSCQFRFRPVTKTGEGAWSQVVTFVVQ